MKALLDTHTFLWWIANSSQLSPTALEVIANTENETFISAASVWEISIKAHRGRLTLPDTPEKVVSEAQAYYRFSTLPVHISHAYRIYDLPDHHSDPFDRLLIAQCQLEGMVLLSADRIFPEYDIRVIW